MLLSIALLQKPATKAAVEEEEDKPDEQVPDMRIAQLAFAIAHGRGAPGDTATVLEVIKEKVCIIMLVTDLLVSQLFCIKQRTSRWHQCCSNCASSYYCCPGVHFLFVTENDTLLQELVC
jgi:hypothetical protein